MKSIAIFASGKGSNAKKIIDHFKLHPTIKIGLIVSSHKEAGVLDIAKSAGIPYLVLDRKSYYGSGESLLKKLKEHAIYGIVLAGFLWLVPEYLIARFDKKIINIHPALLPKYGGKGMYGMHVHEAVWKNEERYTGITIHEVNQRFDEGRIIFQAKCEVDKLDTPIDIAGKVHLLEYEHYPAVIEAYFNA
ncbi:MAG: phosphoribosylglycinamide formyltransferase [Saprospiraceae bacterium]|nr:phosphoribosylglycinamide formyltransferase [Saprospiraceae bacterium]MBK7606505.1 phosphoribosylglycinamide formyltransferase [Saprospiraceae bacterium]MBP7800825.1 phosphoribosylglycinamide formyltransferase [Saprospiraceae bacterium]MBP8095168.1 phosphoribosylglycinamide formyltransferase [Saprospiraceae bacterium]